MGASVHLGCKNINQPGVWTPGAPVSAVKIPLKWKALLLRELHCLRRVHSQVSRAVKTQEDPWPLLTSCHIHFSVRRANHMPLPSCPLNSSVKPYCFCLWYPAFPWPLRSRCLTLCQLSWNVTSGILPLYLLSGLATPQGSGVYSSIWLCLSVHLPLHTHLRVNPSSGGRGSQHVSGTSQEGVRQGP